MEYAVGFIFAVVFLFITKPVKTNAFLVRYKDWRTEYEEVATASPPYDFYIKKMVD